MSGDGTFALLVLGFESSDHPVEQLMDRALAICAEHGGSAGERRGSGGGVKRSEGDGEASGVGAWREAFLRAPYVRDVLVAMGVLSETFETPSPGIAFPASTSESPRPRGRRSKR
jgi:alkyldihydroxyacetonephosphate synthase